MNIIEMYVICRRISNHIHKAVLFPHLLIRKIMIFSSQEISVLAVQGEYSKLREREVQFRREYKQRVSFDSPGSSQIRILNTHI